MAYEAISGRLPDAVQLHFLDTGITGRVAIDHRRLAKGRAKVAAAAAGIRARNFDPKPDRTTCGYCPFKAICPSSVAT
jgi:DNA helicase-2/ATP-dependent DNA helicase PcrA